MEKDPSPNIQNDFFNQIRKEKARVVVYLNSGRKLTGRIKSFDKFTVILDNGQGEQMIFKHAIASVVSAKTFGNYITFESSPGKGKEAAEPPAAAAGEVEADEGGDAAE
jgi:host factor-I protein